MPQLSLTKKLVFALLPTILLLAAAEIGLRVTGAADRCSAFKTTYLLVCDPLLYFKSNPNQIIYGRHVNAEGFRSPPLGPKPPGTYRVIALGDSCTFGIVGRGTGPEWRYISDPYAQRLQELANRAPGGRRVEVINAGVPGYNTYHGVMLMRTVLRGLHPDLVTIRYGWNDHFMSPWGQGHNAYREPTNPAVRFLEGLALHTELYPFARRLGMDLSARLMAASPSAHRMPETWHPDIPIPEYRHNLRRMIELARERGAEAWLVLAPHPLVTDADLAHWEKLPNDSEAKSTLHLSRIQSFRQLREIHERYMRATRAVGTEQGVRVIDMQPIYEAHGAEGLFQYGDVVHPNDRGHELEAETLEETLRVDSR